MNQLVATGRKMPGVAECGQTRSLVIGEGLANAEATLIVNAKAEQPWTDEIFGELWRLTNPRDLGGRGGDERCRRALALAPDTGALDAYIRRLEGVAMATPDQRATRYLIGLLVSAFPHGRPADQDVYCESLLHDAMNLGFPPQVVAGACRALRRTLRFLPAVAEFVEACEAQRREIRVALDYAQRLKERLARAAEIVAAS